jgi:hypothetical protein
MLKDQHDQNKQAYDAKHRDVSFQVGDWVLKRSRMQSSALKGFMSKLAPKWQGPYRVHEVKTPLTYKLLDTGRNQVLDGTYHVTDLKVYHDPLEREAGLAPHGAAGDVEVDVPDRNLRPRGQTQSRLKQAVQDLLGKTRRSEGTSLRVGGIL